MALHPKLEKAVCSGFVEGLGVWGLQGYAFGGPGESPSIATTGSSDIRGPNPKPKTLNPGS